MTRGPAPPPASMRRTSWRSGSFASLDFEATGLDFSRDRIISFGVVPVERGGIDVGRSIYELVDPGDAVMSPQAVTVHGLRPVDVRGANPLEAARAAIREALDSRFLIAWYGIVEASFLGTMFGTRPKPWLKRCVDVRVLVRRLLGAEGSRLTLEQAAERFDVPVASPHHALDDALVTAQLFLVAASALEHQGARTARDLLRLGRSG